MIASISKDFLAWNREKEWINSLDRKPYFNEKEVWWCSIGINVGFEQDGKGNDFSRPVLIFKKFGSSTFWGIPLSTKIKTGPYYFNFFLENGIQNSAILTQLRLFDARRLIEKITVMSDADFLICKKRLLTLC